MTTDELWSKMVEAAAERICCAKRCSTSYDCRRSAWEYEAGAALLAALKLMREPSEAMTAASTMLVPTWDDEASARKYRAMLDELIRAAEGKEQ